ncbi:MAG TPA: hypothetical protein VFY49_00115 [Myxococcota bacterium]|nr:hypothetical protein [Myxococcota bacterium]
MALRRLLFVAVAACVAGIAAVTFVRQPGHAFLVPRDGAEWIRAARPFALEARDLAAETVRFRHRFSRPEAHGDAQLHVQALRSARVFLNDREVGEALAAGAPWRHVQSFDLAPHLQPGMNELRIDVENDRGSPLLLAWSPQLGIATHADWDAELAGGRFANTQAASEERRHAIQSEFPSAWQGLRDGWVLLLAAFALGAGASLAHSASAARGDAWRLRPAHVRWAVVLALAALGLHNLTRMRIDMGFDAPFHFDYIRRVIVSRSVPLASDGWQTFQAPLFYLLAAPPYLVIARLASEPMAMLAMRALVLVCSLGLVEMVYRAARTAFPQRDDLQVIATAVGGFLPMTVYMSHYVSNEPLAALLTAAVVVAAFRLLAEPTSAGSRTGFGLGLLFGLAVLAKVTSLLLLPLLVAVLVRAAQRSSGSLRAAGAPLLRFGMAAAGVAGWYFVRNWIALGSFYLGGWDPSRGNGWNQDPGYRIPQDLLSFGASLSQPIYAVFSGLWDGLYATFWLDGFLGSSTFAAAAPPWRYGYAVACALLALPLTVAGIAGALRACRIPRNPTEETLLFSAAAVLVYVAAIAALFVSLPVYSTVKSTYALGLAPCYGLLFAWGIDLLPRSRAARALVAGYLVAWLAFVFRAYFS